MDQIISQNLNKKDEYVKDSGMKSVHSFNSLMETRDIKTFSFGEEMINQSIEAIEFILGNHSNYI